MTGDEVVFSWQGGEPTLIGLDFFRKVVALQQKHARPGQRIENDLQTNGTLLDEEWAQFLKEHRFLVGLSIDGPRELHDRYRVTKRGAPTFDKVMRAGELLRQLRRAVQHADLRATASTPRGRSTSIASCAASSARPTCSSFRSSSRRASRPRRRSAGGSAQLPMLGTPQARPDHPDSVVTDWSVDPDEYGTFPVHGLRRVAAQRRTARCSSIFFETLVAQHHGPAVAAVHPQRVLRQGRGARARRQPSTPATTTSIRSTGSATCTDSSLGDMVFSPTQVKFGYAKSDTLPQYCRQCAFLTDCWGECPKNRLLRTPDGEPGLNYLCPGLKRFFAHAVPTAERLAAQLNTIGAVGRPRL